MEVDDMDSQPSTSSRTLSVKSGKKSAPSAPRDPSIDREEHPATFSSKSSVSSPHSPAARKVSSSSQNHGFRPVFRSKGVRSKLPNSQNSSMGPPIAITDSIRQTSASSALRPNSQRESISSHRSQHPGSQGNGRKSSGLSLPSPSAGHRARTYVRKTVASNNLTSESASIRRRSVMTAAVPEVFAVKSANAFVPHWHIADDEYQMRSRVNNRTADDAPAGFDFIKRVTVSSVRHRDSPRNNSHHAKNSNHHSHPTAFLGPNMHLRVAGRQDDTRIDEDIPHQHSNIATPRIQMGVKAARKREWPPIPDAETEPEESESSDDDVRNTPSESSDSDSQRVDRSKSDAEMSDTGQEEEGETDGSDHNVVEIVQTSRRSFSPPEIEFLEHLPGKVKTLTPTPPPQALQPTQVVEPSVEPSEEMIAAIAYLTKTSVKTYKTRRRPFLLRNLRRGFMSRCRSLNIPTQRTSDKIAVAVRYEYSSAAGAHAFGTQMEHWVCPCCELLGVFQTREMLASHLDWDHSEIVSQWNEEDMPGQWRLRLVIPELLLVEDRPKQRIIPTRPTATPLPGDQHSDQPSPSPFPYVTLSPPTAAPSLSRTASRAASPVPHKLKFQVSSATPNRPQFSALPSSTRGRSTTAMSAATTVTQKTPRPARYPTPPPSTNPLGPAAQPPYLPATSEYGGPDIFYSCRPSGACLYDLLNTLPMEPFGVLAWDVLDREDEIYDSDNVKDEYKVMHALWARWIILNRNTFIANYYKGTVAFVDAYWKMIHRAAGWDALRFWLLLLLAERFITAHEVANVLRHYESLTGMEFWYD